jgi:uncharacterized protein YbjT (DUF2867 family)
MSEKKIIAVVGATGAQGGGLARAILADRSGAFGVRAITRDVNSEKARALAAQGADVVAANLDDPPTLDKAFDGAFGAFCVTNYWEHLSPEREIAQAKGLAESAKRASLRHVIWSTLEDTRQLVPLDDDRMPTLLGKYKVPHFDTKGESDHYFRDAGVPATFLLTSFYWENLIYFGMGPKKGPDGVLTFALPMADKRLPGIGTEDIGRCAYGIFNAGDAYIGKTVGVSGEILTGEQMAASLSKALGMPVKYAYVPPEVYRTFGFPGADDLANMFQYKRDFESEFCGPRDPRIARSLNPALQSFDQWLAANKERIAVE